MVEPSYTLCTKALEAVSCLIWCFFAIKMSLGEELVCKANKLFRCSLRLEIRMRQW